MFDRLARLAFFLVSTNTGLIFSFLSVTTTSVASETVATESKENVKPVCTPAQPEGQPFQTVRSSSGNVYNFVFN